MKAVSSNSTGAESRWRRNQIVDHSSLPYFLHAAVPMHSHIGAPGTSAWVQSQLSRPISNKPCSMQRLDTFSIDEVQAADLLDAEAVAVMT